MKDRLNESEAHAIPGQDGRYQLTVRATRFAKAVHIDARGYHASDDFFHVEPDHAHSVTLTPTGRNPRSLNGTVQAANGMHRVRITTLPDASRPEL